MLALRRAPRAALTGAIARAAAPAALTLAALASSCVIVERHYYPVGGPLPPGAPTGATAAAPTSAPGAVGAPATVGAVGAAQASGEVTVPAGQAAPTGQVPVALDPQHAPPPQFPGPAGDYADPPSRFVFTVDASLEVDDQESLYGFGFYVVPAESPVGFYMNTRFTAHSYDYPDFTYLFAYNAFDHEVVDEELMAFVLNFGLVKPLVGDWFNLFAGIGFASTETEVELRDPSGVLGDNGTYYQRINGDDDFNFNVGALIVLESLALNAQWDTALEVFTFGVGFAF